MTPGRSADRRVKRESMHLMKKDFRSIIVDDARFLFLNTTRTKFHRYEKIIRKGNKIKLMHNNNYVRVKVVEVEKELEPPYENYWLAKFVLIGGKENLCPAMVRKYRDNDFE